MKLLFASSNAYKIAEIKGILPHGFQLISLKEIHQEISAKDKGKGEERKKIGKDYEELKKKKIRGRRRSGLYRR